MAVDIGPRIGLDGEKEYRAQLQNVIQAQKTLNSEMKLLASSFDDSTSAEEKARKTGELLARQVDNQKARVALLQSQYDKAAEALGENDTKTLKWKQALNVAQTELNRLEGELDQTESGVDDLTESMEEAEKETSVFGDVLLANLASKAVEAGIDALRKGIEGAIGVIKESVSAYSSFEQLSGGVETLFKKSSDEVLKYANNAYKTAGVSANQYLDTVTSFSASLISGLGGDTETAAKIADVAITDMADNANKMGSDMQSLMTVYQNIAKGQFQTLDNLKLGYGGSQQEMIRLINDSGVLEEKITSLDGITFDQMIEAIHAVQENLGITGATAEEADSTIEGSMNAASAAWQNLLAGLGDSDADLDTLTQNVVDAFSTAAENLIPRIGEVMIGLAGALPEMASAIYEAAPQVTAAILDSIIGALPQQAQDAVQKVLDFAEWVKSNGPAVAATIAGIGAAFAAWNVGTMILGLANAIKAFKAANEGATVAQAILNGVMMANPAVLIATIIAALVAGIVVFIATNKNAQEALKKAWDAIKNAVSTAVQTAKSALDGLKTGVSNAVSGVSSAISGVVTTVKTTLTSLPSKALTWGKDFIQGFINGIKAKLSAVAQAAKDIANKVKSFLHFSRPDVGPLRDYQTWAKDFVVGYSKAMRSELPTIGRTAQLMADTMAAPMRSGVTNMGGVSINVYGRDGQSVNELADAVMERMQLMVERKGAIYR